MKSTRLLACATIILSGLLPDPLPALATDELYLCGVVQNINPSEGTIIVDVATKGCRGSRKFKLPPLKGGTAIKLDDRKCFFIDSNHCKAGYTHTITKTR